ncbi:hypothetical protein [Dysgonomonas sp. 25]|uniref:hypothetical protein n=1 Tax=Dysgonomonas sp. 25 TaxID=2302933 RepID=UPI0013D7388F|nr:hypothetical protein [Dysgonomonas sp. 25]NDV68864.1 hypothetical protein [Dysgonomonas sp. 25]
MLKLSKKRSYTLFFITLIGIFLLLIPAFLVRNADTIIDGLSPDLGFGTISFFLLLFVPYMLVIAVFFAINIFFTAIRFKDSESKIINCISAILSMVGLYGCFMALYLYFEMIFGLGDAILRMG